MNKNNNYNSKLKIKNIMYYNNQKMNQKYKL